MKDHGKKRKERLFNGMGEMVNGKLLMNGTGIPYVKTRKVLVYWNRIPEYITGILEYNTELLE